MADVTGGISRVVDVLQAGNGLGEHALGDLERAPDVRLADRALRGGSQELPGNAGRRT